MSKNIEELSYNELQKLANKLGAEKVIGVKGDDLKKFIKENQEEQVSEVEDDKTEENEKKNEEIDIVEVDEVENKVDLKITVTREGRDGIFIPNRKSLILWLRNNKIDKIHHMHSGNHMMIGSEWSLESTIKMINDGNKVGLLINEAASKNLDHSLSVVVVNGELNMFDIGVLTEKNFDIQK